MHGPALIPQDGCTLAMRPVSPADTGMQLAFSISTARVYLEPELRRVFINGTHNADTVTVSASSSNSILVNFSGIEFRQFNTADFDYVLFKGRNGNDTFNNLSGVPAQAFGDGGDDRLMGGIGDSLLDGGSGDDQLYGRDGPDRILGGPGNDLIFGANGDDWLRGGDGNDIIYGEGGNDTLLGDDGDDQLNGGNHHDTLYGWTGNDQLDGGDGADRLYGWDGNDALVGGGGNDLLAGGAGTDSLAGGTGDDVLYGGDGDDALAGDSGNDYLAGDAGNDQLQGGLGVDTLIGAAGSDVLTGGINTWERDVLRGGGGQDHLLYFDNHALIDANPAIDVRVRFSNSTSSWTEQEILVIDRGLRKLHDATGNSRLLRDWVTGDDLNLVKVNFIAGGGTAVNVLEYSTRNGVTTYRREIRFSEWNEQSEPINYTRVLGLVHEIGHNFDNDFELAATPNNGPWVFTHFRSLSGWRDTNPNHPAWTRSGDGQWWYLNTSQFYRSYSTLNPYEDWSTVWELYFDETATLPPLNSGLGLKLTDLSQFIARLRS